MLAKQCVHLMGKAVWQIPRNTVDLMGVDMPEVTPRLAQTDLHIMWYDE